MHKCIGVALTVDMAFLFAQSLLIQLVGYYNNMMVLKFVFQYEHKVYGTKKEKTELSVSVTGIKVVHRGDGKRNWIKAQHVNLSLIHMFSVNV